MILLLFIQRSRLKEKKSVDFFDGMRTNVIAMAVQHQSVNTDNTTFNTERSVSRSLGKMPLYGIELFVLTSPKRSIKT